jgi:hypothetical protein
VLQSWLSLCLLYNISLNTGVIPNDFRCANVIPIFKKGNADLVNNYRPISILPTAEKVFERCIHNVIYPITRQDINSNQHGFMGKRSTTTQLLEFYNNVHLSLENVKQFDVAFLDLSKAFDRVSHTLLIHKLTSYGFNGKLLNWFMAYLKNRKQTVIVNGACSDQSVVSSGVPQGSILGPLLFLYFINDVFKYIDNDSALLYLYADDAKIGHPINSISDCLNLQKCLDNMSMWCKDWGMVFNTSKSVTMSFCKGKQSVANQYVLDGTPIIKVSEFVDLGILVTEKLSWDAHIDSQVKKANQRLGLVKRTTGYSCNTDVKLVCFTSLVRPLVEFTSQLWAGNYTKKSLLKLESLQRRASKFILNDYVSPYDVRLTRLKLLPLSYRREFLDLVYFYNCINSLIDMETSHLPIFITHNTVRTRLANDDLLLSVPKVKYMTYNKYYMCRITRLWNALPLDIRNVELTTSGCNTSFKRSLKDWFFEHLINSFESSNTCTWSICCKCFNCTL